MEKSGENFYSLEYQGVVKVFLRILLLGIRIASNMYVAQRYIKTVEIAAGTVFLPWM